MLFYFTFVFVSHKMSLHYCHICSLVCFSLEYNVKFPKNIHNRKRQFYLNNMYPLVFFSFTLFPPSVPLILSGPGSVCKIQAIWRNYVVCVYIYIYIYIRSKRMVWKKKNTHSIGILLVYLSIYKGGGMKHTQAHCILHPMPKTRASPPPPQTQSCKKP